MRQFVACRGCDGKCTAAAKSGLCKSCFMKAKRVQVACHHCGKIFVRLRCHVESAASRGCKKTFCPGTKCWAAGRRGEGSYWAAKGAFIGKGHVIPGGYRRLSVPCSSGTRKRKWMLEHRFVWECAHGPLPDGATIHHKNGNRLDNRLENLELFIGNHGVGSSLLDIAADQCVSDPKFYSDLTLRVLQLREKSA